ncbi:MAG: ABC-2 transporter permease, partial [Sphaerochaetaceae bacterium]|nr:ABC-2 transporter permease [Sphaerochaetaceae bacterium]
MIGLMYKDMMLATLNGKSLLIILLIMLIPFITSGSTTMITTIPMIMTLLLTMTMFAYDNLNKWDRYAMVLP